MRGLFALRASTRSDSPAPTQVGGNLLREPLRVERLDCLRRHKGPPRERAQGALCAIVTDPERGH